MKKYIHPSAAIKIVLCLWIIPMISHGDNVMEFVSTTTGPNQNVTIQVKITNDDDFVAFQFEMLLPEEYTYVASSAQLNPNRVMDHVLQDTLFPDRKLRIFGYSLTNTPFSGDTGTIVTFQFHTGYDPGSYTLSFQNPVIGGAGSTNILTGAIQGILDIQCPDITFTADAIDFDAIPLTDSTDRILTIYNTGNQDLSIQNITFDSPYFFVAGSSSFTIQGGQSSDVTVRFLSVIKGNYTQQMTITSNDPDEPSSAITLTAYAFPVNEIHTGNVFGYSGKQVTLNFSINNMEPFVGFQFDLCLPSPLTYISNSAALSPRKANHTVSANMVSAHVLRVVAYSQDNQTFSGDDGDVLSLGFDVYGLGGYYGLNLENVLIGDIYGQNCISAFYNGTLEIAAPDIHSSGSLNFEDVSVMDTTSSFLTVYNVGSDTLTITSIQFSNNHFYTDMTFSVNVLINDSTTIPLYFHNSTKGSDQGQMKIFSNDPDEYPYIVNLTGYSFHPNYLIVEDAIANFTGEIQIKMSTDNYDEFVGFQFDLQFPDILSYIPGSATLTNRAQNHSIYSFLIDSTHLRIFAYSMQQKKFLGNSGSIAYCRFMVNTDHAETYSLNLQNTILGDQNSENILYASENGQLDILDPENYQLIDISAGWSGISSYIQPNDNLLVNIFSSVVSNLVILMDMAHVYWPSQGINTIIYWDSQTGYKINVTSTIQLVMIGNTVSDKTVHLPGGWYILPVLSQGNVSTMQTDILSSLGDTLTIVKEIAGNKIYWPGQNIYSLQYLKSGKSYMIHTSYNCLIIYPDSSQFKSICDSESEHFSGFNLYKVTPTPNSHIIAVSKAVIAELKTDDVIGCFTQSGICGGSFMLLEKTQNIAMTVYGNDPTSEVQDGFYENETMNFKIYRPSTGEEFCLFPSYDKDLPNYNGKFITNGLSKIKEAFLLNIKENESPFGLIHLFPNPAKNYLTIYFKDKIDDEIQLEIFSLEGNSVKNVVPINIQSFQLDVRDYNAGVYIFKFTSGGKSYAKKMIIN